jgi:TolA-binding protein
MRLLFRTSTLVIALGALGALAAPAAAQAPNPAPPAPPAPPAFAAPPAPLEPFVFAFAQAPEPSPDRAASAAERSQAAEERAEAARQRAAARAEANARVHIEGGGFRIGIPPIDVDAIYEQAREAIERSRFDIAIQDLDRVLMDSAKTRADAAMYWKAYSQSRIAESQAALKTIQDLTKEFANSPWAKDAKALAVEIQAANGQPVSAELQNDEELKLLALRGVMQADPDKGVPIIEKMLAGGGSPRVRDRALFVLSQSRSARAREIMLNTAKNNNNPELQRSAIKYLGMMGGAEDREALNGIYRSATDPAVKRAIVASYFMSGNIERMIDLAKNEKDPDLRRTAIRNLGMMNRQNGASTSDALVSIYKADSSIDIRRQVVNSLFMQHNARALVELARAEKDPSMKKELVSKLSTMKAPEATDYMLELLK